MRKLTIFIFLIFPFLAACNSSPAPKADLTSLTSKIMEITSPAFQPNQSIPSLYTCDGQNINPPLKIQGIPENTASLALIFDDPDAPVGTWVHWIMWNISPDTTNIAPDSVPTGAVLGANSWGRNDYGGPCPPSGRHRYIFKIYALDISLNLPTSTDSQSLQTAMQGHILDNTQLISLYQR